jgi:hypothetical protein
MTLPTPIALCYYSGPSSLSTVTPCVLNASNNGATATCTCYVIPANNLYSVDINAISNLEVYINTSATVPPATVGCGEDGSLCTITNSAPVCGNIEGNTLIPGAQLISAFSDYLNPSMPVDSQTSCTSMSTMGLYAGCMTAPCVLTNNYDTEAPPLGTATGLQLATCTCPTFSGPYQIGLPGQTCPPPGSNVVWSASYTKLSTSPPPGFAGVPGTANCNGVSVAALAQQFGDISHAAQATGFGTVKNLQSAIKTFCGK